MTDTEQKVTFNGTAEHDTEPAYDEADDDDTPKTEPLFNKDSAQNVCVKEPRTFKKARRVHSSSFSYSGPNGITSGGINGVDVDRLAPSLSKGVHISSSKVPFGKNSKKSRTGLKGLPKKGGGGGKGVWGKPGSEISYLELDENDPDYDSDVCAPVKLERVDTVMELKEFEDTVTSWIEEYYDHGLASEIIENLNEINATDEHRKRLPYIAISLALQRKPLQCELTSELLSELCGHALSGADMQYGFDLVLRELPDMILDAPDAAELVGMFVARAVADDLLPPKFVQGHKGRTECPHAVKSLAKAETLLSMNHAYARLDSVWGQRGGIKPTKMLMKKIRLLLQEYLCSNDVDEAARCLRELEAPHFHHEFVYQAISMALEKSSADVNVRLLRLIGSFSRSVVLTPDQLEMGLHRVYAAMPDIQLDVPNAYQLLERFVTQGREHGFISDKLVKEVPSKGRKRFVSEGDGGLIKEPGLLFL